MSNVAFHGSLKLRALFYFICEENTETHHFIECPPFRNNYSSLWSNLKTKIINFNQTDGITISDFITNLDPHQSFIIAGRTQSTFL